MKNITKEQVLEGALFAFECVAFGSSVLFAVVGATFEVAAGVLTAGAQSICNKRSGKEEDKYDFNLYKLKDTYASVVSTYKGYFNNMLIVKGGDRRAPTGESVVKPLFQKVPVPASEARSEGSFLSEEERDVLDDVINEDALK